MNNSAIMLFASTVMLMNSANQNQLDIIDDKDLNIGMTYEEVDKYIKKNPNFKQYRYSFPRNAEEQLKATEEFQSKKVIPSPNENSDIIEIKKDGETFIIIYMRDLNPYQLLMKEKRVAYISVKNMYGVTLKEYIDKAGLKLSECKFDDNYHILFCGNTNFTSHKDISLQDLLDTKEFIIGKSQYDGSERSGFTDFLNYIFNIK